MEENILINNVRDFVFELLKNELSNTVVYHTFNHTESVVNAVIEIAESEMVSPVELEVLVIAAWFHDSGFVKSIENHEEEGKIIAANFLKSSNYDNQKLEKVLELIDATKMPQKPKNKLEKIICDADLYHLGTVDYFQTVQLLQLEWELLYKKEYSDSEWLSENEIFLGNHKFFTNYAYKKLEFQKLQNRVKLQKELKKIVAKQEENAVKLKTKKDTLNLKKKKDNRPERGIETMFRVTLQNHIKLSDIADTKANILLSVSAIILSIALSNLFPKLDKTDNTYLIIPTLIFIFITVITMIFSILSTRPKVTSGSFTKEDIAEKKVNLLFFGNFHKMSLEDFTDGMTGLMEDRDYLYNTLIKDLYFLGLVLDKKYKLLRIAYTIFMFGIIITVVAFIIAFQLMKLEGVTV